MKRLALLLTCVAALALTAGCNKDAAKMSDTLTATFNVTLPGDMPTKAISDGTLATELLFMVFDSEDHHLEALDQTVAVNGKKATVTTDLVRGVDYKFVFWAQKPGKYSFAEKNGRYVLEISANALPSMMNDDTWDAFYASEAVEAQVGDFTLDVTLYRPFAQLNVGSSAEDIAVAEANAVDLGINLKTAFTIDGVKNVLDLVSGTASGAESVTYTAALAPTDYIVTTDNETYRRIAMVYVLAANQSSTSQVTLNVQSRQSNSIDLAFAREVPNVPLRRNHRTNIVGEIFSLTGTFNVLVDERFDEPEYNVDIDVPAAAPTTYNVSVYENIVNGTVAVDAETTSFEEGETVTLTVQPDENYELSMLTYAPADGGSAVDIDMQTLQFAMPAYDVVVSARFAYVEPGPTEPEYTGSGTADDPYTVADVRKYIDGLGDAGTVSDNAVYVKGVVKSIAGRPSATYSNASFYMTDPDGTDEFEAFRIYFLGDNPWTVNDIMVAEGDEVVVCGKVKLYVSGSNQTYETNQVPNGDHGYLVSLNGKSAAADAPTIEARDVTGAPVTVIPVGSNGITVTITAAQGATVRYTTDGNDPTENSPVYTSPFLVSEACTVKAFVEGDDTTLASAVASLKITKDSGTTYSWVATPLAQIPTGSEIVIVSQKGDAYYAMSNNNGTISAPSAVAVTVTNDTMDTPDDNIIWTLTKAEGTTTETYQFGTGDSYLYCTAANNGLRVGTGDNKTFHVNVDNDYLVNDGQTRYVGVYNAQDWRSYTSVNNNISGQTFLYFMKTN